MNINNMTLGKLREINSLFNTKDTTNSKIDKKLIGKKVITRTYSAGVHYGTLTEKEGHEVILKNARRLYYWKTINNGISLSSVAMFGLSDESKVCFKVTNQWLVAVEIIPCSDESIKSIEGKNEYRV